MTPGELAFYQQTLLARQKRLGRLIVTYADDLNPMGQRMLSRALVAVTGDYIASLTYAPKGPTNISSAPPPPAESSPEDYP